MDLKKKTMVIMKLKKYNAEPIKNTFVEKFDPPSKKKSMVSDYDFNSKKVVTINEPDVEDTKKVLREEFEAQLEYSLARINTEKLSHLIEREPKEIPSVERGITIGARMMREVLKTEETTTGNDNNPIWTQNLGEDTLGSFRGFNDNSNIQSDHKNTKNYSPQISESDNNSPTTKLKKVEFRNQDFRTPEPEYRATAQESDRLGVIPEVEEVKQRDSIINIKNLRPVQTQAV